MSRIAQNLVLPAVMKPGQQEITFECGQVTLFDYFQQLNQSLEEARLRHDAKALADIKAIRSKQVVGIYCHIMEIVVELYESG